MILFYSMQISTTKKISGALGSGFSEGVDVVDLHIIFQEVSSGVAVFSSKTVLQLVVNVEVSSREEEYSGSHL